MSERKRIVLLAIIMILVAALVGATTMLFLYDTATQAQTQSGQLVDVKAAFVRTGFIAAGTGIIAICLGLLAFIRVTRPLLRQLEESERQLRRAVVHAPFPIMIHSEDGNVIMTSKVWNEISGYREEEIPTTAVWTQKAFGQRREAAKADIDALYSANGRVAEGEYEVTTAGGEKRVWDFCSAPLGEAADGKRRVISMAMDVTARKLAELASREIARRFRVLFNSGNDAIFVQEASADGAPGWFIEVNDVACQRLGYDREDMLQMTAVEVDAPETRHLLPQRMEALRANGRATWEGIHLTRDGRKIPVEVSNHLFVLLGRPAIMSVARDITDRLLAQETMAKAREVAESASRTKDRLLAMLSHELRTPLTPVLITLSSLEEDSHLPELLRGDIGMMRRNIELEAELIDGLLDLTRITRGEIRLSIEIASAHDLVDRALAMAAEETESHHPKVICELRATQFTILVDASRFQQVCWNIIRNAMHFTADTGTLTITSRNTIDGFFELEFTDTGAGIEPEFLPHIFELFEQGGNGDPRWGGRLGLGLTVARSLVQQLGGTIRANSPGLGKGSTFTIRLPVARCKRALRPAEPAAEQATTKSLHILLVEDHTPTLRVLGRLMDTMGHSVRSAATVKQALTHAQSDKFDLLISDINLPDGSGLEVMRWFGRHQPIAGIALSGFGSAADIDLSREAGFALHLVKPVTVSVLREAIPEAIAMHEQILADAAKHNQPQ